MPSAEFSRPVCLARLTGQELVIDVSADAGERDRTARRLQIAGVGRLQARFSLRRLPAGIIEAHGLLQATVTQECVVSLDPFDSAIREPFTVRFVPAETLDDELLDPEAIDEIAYEGDDIDLGEAVVEQLALALDPFPRQPGVALPAGVSDEADDQAGEGATIHPFAALRSRDPS